MSDNYWATDYVVPACRSEHRAMGMVRFHLKQAGLDPDAASNAHFVGTPSEPKVIVMVFGEQPFHDRMVERFEAVPKHTAAVPTQVVFGVAKFGDVKYPCLAHPTVCCLIEPREGMYLGDHSETCRTTMLRRPIPKLSTDRLDYVIENLRITL